MTLPLGMFVESVAHLLAVAPGPTRATSFAVVTIGLFALISLRYALALARSMWRPTLSRADQKNGRSTR